MCAVDLPFSITPEDLKEMAEASGMFWCRSCKKTFILKTKNPECPHCGSKEIKPRAP